MSAVKPLRAKLDRRIAATESLLCVGIDPVAEKMPAHLPQTPDAVLQFCLDIVEATLPYAAAYKPNLGFFAGLGRTGFNVLWAVRHAIPNDVPVILDAKTNDMGETAKGYAKGYFAEFGFDMVTVSPYMGEDASAPYMDYADHGILVLCKNSNAGSGDFQDMILADNGLPLYLHVADRARDWQETYPGEVGYVVGATYPSELKAVRDRCPDQIILLPGIGAQGGDLEGSIEVGLDRTGSGLLCSASRAVMFASSGEDYAEAAASAAEGYRDQIQRARNLVLAG